jgi:uncharacterized protein (DUF169 family)
MIGGKMMVAQEMTGLHDLLDALGLDEEPMGIFFSDHQPSEGISPKQGDLPTREKEAAGEIDWQTIFGQFSCAVGHIWRARKKKTAAYFDAEHFGCPGAAFWLGFMKPQTETIIHYVSSGIPDQMEGEHYCESPEALETLFNHIDPVPALKRYCIIKPLGLFSGTETPLLVTFFARPESLSGIHQLATYVTNDPEVVVSPWGAACTDLVTWPIKYLTGGQLKAVVGGWDPSARKFFKTDELSFTIPHAMFQSMLLRWKDSFLTTSTWAVVRKKIQRSKKAWGEIDA